MCWFGGLEVLINLLLAYFGPSDAENHTGYKFWDLEHQVFRAKMHGEALGDVV